VRRFAPQLSAQLFCISLLFSCISHSQAQIANHLTAQQQIQNREWALENLRRQARLQPNTRERRIDQITLRNDFRQLQIVNNSLMARVFETAPETQKITNKEIRSSLSEIKKLAERLRSSLAIPKAEPKPEPEPGPGVDLPVGLRQLDEALMRFVDNPLFKQPRVYDTEMATQAAGDLTEVVRLADALKKLIKN
jgi:hypothetical protein